MPVRIKISLNSNLYLKDPQDTALGQLILKESIEMIDAIGFEQFTFKKLAIQINSTEASVYRYFENKHMLLLYLASWSWEWMKWNVDQLVQTATTPYEKLVLAIRGIVSSARQNADIDFIDEYKLYQVMLKEGPKAYHTHKVDEENEKGIFLTYKTLSLHLADIILENNPRFPYPKSLASTILEMPFNHLFYAMHLPRLTDVQIKEADPYVQVEKMVSYFALQMLGIQMPSNGSHGNN